MRFFSFALAMAVLALGAVTAKESALAYTHGLETTVSEQSEQQIARSSGRNSTAHRGSGRRQVLAITMPTFR